MWNERFLANSINSLNDVLENNQTRSEQSNPVKSVSESNCVNLINEARMKQPIGKQDKRNSQEASKNHCSTNARNCTMNRIPSIKLLNEKHSPANYVANNILPKLIALVKNYNKFRVTRLPAPWREKCRSFSIDSNEFLYMDSRSVIPQSMRTMIMCSLHYGHPNRDAMLFRITGICWHRIHGQEIDHLVYANTASSQVRR